VANETIVGNITLYFTNGSHNIQVFANDTSGNMGASQKVYFTVNAPPPVANFTYFPEVPKVGEIVTFNGSSSSSSGGMIASYQWDFGDGQTASGLTATHAYASATSYTVTLNVTDTSGLWGINQEQVRVVTGDTSPPTTTLIIGDPKCNTTKTMSVISSTPFTLNATDPDGKSDVKSTFYTVFNATLLGNWQKYLGPFTLIGYKNGNYTIAYYSVDIAGNTELTKEVKVVLCRAYDNLGDVTGDGKVDIYDMAMICMSYDSKPGDANWNPIVDFCQTYWSNNVIDIYDLVTCLQYYGP
jgi:PKD repeat protein